MFESCGNEISQQKTPTSSSLPSEESKSLSESPLEALPFDASWPCRGRLARDFKSCKNNLREAKTAKEQQLKFQLESKRLRFTSWNSCSLSSSSLLDSTATLFRLRFASPSFDFAMFRSSSPQCPSWNSPCEEPEEEFQILVVGSRFPRPMSQGYFCQSSEMSATLLVDATTADDLPRKEDILQDGKVCFS